jgi:hypothetical protein
MRSPIVYAGGHRITPVHATKKANGFEHRVGAGNAAAIERQTGLSMRSPIVDAGGHRMTPVHATKKAKRYRYYVSESLLAGDRPQTQKGMRVPAGGMEGLVLERLRAFFSCRTDVSDALAPVPCSVLNRELFRANRDQRTRKRRNRECGAISFMLLEVAICYAAI